MNKHLLSLLKHQITDYERYETGDLKVIGYDLPHSDSVVNCIFSYSEWIRNYHRPKIIKVEGIENISEISSCFFNNLKNIHLFVHQKFGESFSWHKDNLNVYLYVIKGRKKVFIKNKIFNLYPGQGVIIPKGYLHKVLSTSNTWALSIGYE